jgi:hypothetical protein
MFLSLTWTAEKALWRTKKSDGQQVIQTKEQKTFKSFFLTLKPERKKERNCTNNNGKKIYSSFHFEGFVIRNICFLGSETSKANPQHFVCWAGSTIWMWWQLPCQHRISSALFKSRKGAIPRGLDITITIVMRSTGTSCFFGGRK